MEEFAQVEQEKAHLEKQVLLLRLVVDKPRSKPQSEYLGGLTEHLEELMKRLETTQQLLTTRRLEHASLCTQSASIRFKNERIRQRILELKSKEATATQMGEAIKTLNASIESLKSSFDKLQTQDSIQEAFWKQATERRCSEEVVWKAAAAYLEQSDPDPDPELAELVVKVRSLLTSD